MTSRYTLRLFILVCIISGKTGHVHAKKLKTETQNIHDASGEKKAHLLVADANHAPVYPVPVPVKPHPDVHELHVHIHEGKSI